MTMKEGKKIFLLLLILSTLLGAFGQVLFKYSLSPTGILKIYLVGGILMYLLSTVVYLYVLSRTNLSWAYALAGLSYVFAVVLAVLFLRESVTLLRLSGVIVIALGAALVGSS
jgi:drug/metabolite transporter (DMT)-like permease